MVAAVVVALSGTSGGISWPQNPVTCPPLITLWKGQNHGLTSFLLPTRSVGPRLALHHVAPHLAQAKRSHPHRTSYAHPAQAQTLQRAQTVCRPDHQAPLCPVCTRSRPSSTGTAGAPRVDAPNPPASPHGGPLAAPLYTYRLAL